MIVSLMISTDKTLDFIISEFPEFELEITELYHESSNFIEICEDYQLCLDSIHRVKSIKKPGYQNNLRTLQEALHELQAELITKLKR